MKYPLDRKSSMFLCDEILNRFLRKKSNAYFFSYNIYLDDDYISEVTFLPASINDLLFHQHLDHIVRIELIYSNSINLVHYFDF